MCKHVRVPTVSVQWRECVSATIRSIRFDSIRTVKNDKFDWANLKHRHRDNTGKQKQTQR